MNSLNSNKVFPKTLFPKTIFGKDIDTNVEVTFNVENKYTGEAINITAIKVDNKNRKFTQVDKAVTMKVSEKDTFNLVITADDCEEYTKDYTASTLNGSTIKVMPLHIKVTFNLEDKLAGTAVTPTTLKLDDVDTPFTQEGKAITIIVPTDKNFTLDLEANDYVKFSNSYMFKELNLATIQMMPMYAKVTFNLADSITGNAVTPTSFKIDGAESTYTQSGKVVITTVPTLNTFTLAIEANQYNNFSDSFTYETLNGGTINMVKTQEVGNMQVLVSWTHDASQTSRDLDSYLYIYTNSTMSAEAMNHIYHGHKDSENEHTHIQLVKDDTGRDTGETINFIPFYKNYTYRFYIEDYSHRTSTAPSGFADWHAKVTVTYQNQIVFSSEAPSSARGVYWDVFKLVNGEFTAINNFTDTKPIG